MIKELVIYGMGMIVDLSGSQFTHSQFPSHSTRDAIASDWARVGMQIQHAFEVEGPAIKADAAKQLELKLS
ncbi:MAG TPA: hypothetical protein VGY98_14820 [Verrucomicrobiae bacterium]|nr:hypothetical protein [Verrucomicrobiae bacterium]